MSKRSSRFIAVSILMEVLQQEQPLTMKLIQKADLTPKDKPLIQAICYGTLKHFEQLDWLSQRLLSKPLKSKDYDIYLLVLISLYQIIHLRTPDHATVNEAVKCTHHLKKSWAAKLVNAVLRAFLRQQTVLLAQLESEQSLDVNTCHPTWLIEQLQKDWPNDWQSILSANQQHPPFTLRINTQQISRDNYLKILPEEMTASKTTHADDGITLSQATAVEALPQFASGMVSVQDQAPQLVPQCLLLEPGLRILDACAAPGGKTIHIREAEPNIAELTAIEINPQRANQLQQNLSRTKIDADVIVEDVTQTTTWWDNNLYDRILIDAPCSGTGVIRRHPDIKYLKTPETVLSLQQQQEKILTALWPLLKKGGILLYCTCSVLAEENTQQMECFLANHHDARELKIEANWGTAQHVGRQILTGEDNMDGFYYARIEKI